MRKIISLVICLMLFVPAIPGGFAADGGFNRNLSLDEINFLEGVGILEEADVFSGNTEFTVTKGEAARLLIRMSGYAEDETGSSEAESPYRDVKGTTNHRNEIIAATRLGFFGRDYSAYFYPDDTAETMWFAKAAARALGYGAQLDFQGDTLIYRLKLLKGVSSKADRYLRRDGALKILCNAAEVPVMKDKGVSEGGRVNNATREKTLLTEYFGVYNDEDVLLSDYYNSACGERCAEGQARIGNTVYYTGDINTEQLIGRKIKFYYKSEDGRKTLLYIKLLENKVTEISADNAEYSYAEHCYYVYNNNKKVKMSLKSDSLISYNGEAYYDKSLMKPKTGSVTLIDNDSDGAYEVCLIREFTNVIISSVDVNSGIIHDRLDINRNIKTGDFTEFYIYGEGRKALDLSDLKNDTVLTVYKNIKGDKCEAYVTKKTLSLQLKSINSGKNTLLTDDGEYKLSGDLRFDAESLSAGKSYFFYLNYWNEAVYATEDGNYTAFWIAGAYKKDGIEPKFYIKGLEESGNVRAYELSEKVRIYTYADGRKTLAKEAVYNLIAPQGAVNRQLVKLSADSSETVKEIVFAYEAQTHGDILNMTQDFPLIHAAYYGDVSLWHSKAIYNSANKTARLYSPNTFGNWLTYTNKSIEMQVPTNSTSGNWDYEDLKVNNVRFGSSSAELVINPDNFNVYYSGKDRVAVDYMIKDINNSSEVNWRSDGYFLSPYIVSSVETVLNSEGGKALRLELTSRYGEKTVYYAKDAETLEFENLLNNDACSFPPGKTSVEPGDIIAFEPSADKIIKKARLVYDGKGMQDVYVGTKFPNTTSDCLTGTVLRAYDGIAEFGVLGGCGNDVEADVVYNADVNRLILEYDGKTDEVRSLKAEQINPGDRIVAYYRYGAIYMAVIYK